jgi:hypothetical protein
MTQGRRHELRLQVRVDELRGIPTPQLIPWVDGSVLFLDLQTRAASEASGLGMDPAGLLGRDSPLLPFDPGDVRELADQPPLAVVWRCSCGIPGDASIGLRVRRELDPVSGHPMVVWDDWRIQFGTPEDLASPGPLRFDAAAYYGEFIRLQADPWWDNVPRRVGHELAACLDAHPELLAWWGTALLFARGYLRCGQGVLEIWLRHTAGRCALELPCPIDVDPASEAQRIAERLADTDPASWDECRALRGL